MFKKWVAACESSQYARVDQSSTCFKHLLFKTRFFALSFFFIALAPVSGLIPINQPRADRFLYLPSVAAALAVGWLWDWAQARWRTVLYARIDLDEWITREMRRVE